MKRLIVVTMAALAVASAFAQGTFTIRRPSDGSRVRETVAVRIPRNSIPEGGYIGILVNGKFLEAVVPPVEGQDYVYNLDTKKRGLPDGETTIEAVLYLYTEGNPVVLNRSSVTVNLDNSASINVPSGGLDLRYRYTPGKEWVYNMVQSSTVSMLTQAQAQLGSRANAVELETERFRYLVAIDNAYNSGNAREGLVRFQALPDRGKDYAWLTVSSQEEPRKVMDYEMHPLYMRLTSKGREVFASAPPYFPLEGTRGEAFSYDLFALFPLPVLPDRPRTVGESWQTPITFASLDLTQLYTGDKFTTSLPGRATLEAVEWESGHPTARIRSVLKMGARDLNTYGVGENLNNIQGEPQSIEFEQVYWFALDLGQVVRDELNVTTEALVTVGGTAGAGSFGAPGGATGGAPGGGAGPTLPGNRRSDIRGMVMGNMFDLSSALRQARPGGVPSNPGPGGQGGPGAVGGGDTGAAGQQGGVKMIVRVQQRITRTLAQ